MAKLDFVVYVGRFSPFHLGHLETLKQALDKAKQVIILLGSSNRSPNLRNPFNFQQRSSMIHRVIVEEGLPAQRIMIMPINDYPYQNNRWIQNIQDTVAGITSSYQDDPTIGIIGFKRDHTSFYLDMFQPWESVETKEVDKINATEIRNMFFHNKGDCDLPMVPSGVQAWMKEFAATYPDELARLCREYWHIRDYHQQWANTPYAVQFITADAVVVQSGHILLVQRDAQPGEGQWALPGGFVNPKEFIVDAAIRELVEETRIKVPTKVLRGSIKGKECFDDPDRSLRGRTITHAFMIQLADGPLPSIKGSDDARKAKWFTLSEFSKMEQRCFEDHWSIGTIMMNDVR